ncbi:NAD(+) diphosphatase [Alloscardovia criceti]|uniref:NAD(+) diphosphatase n=1 Tax=Alloscardovia criceti TaxID=356828 RepID=UPI00036471A7|nr:NAD(+) diphosphatase [Alloscardovia criceti]
MAIKYFDIPVYTYHRALGAETSADIPLVLIHAFPVDHHVWDRTAEQMIKRLGPSRDVTILAVDMPGAGTNPAPSTELIGEIAADGAYTEAMDRMASSIVHAINALGYEKAIYVGISMGGYATLSIVRQFPQAVAGMALCDTKPDADTPDQRARRLDAARQAEEEATLAPVVHFAQPQDGDSEFKKSEEFIRTFMGWISEQTPAGIAFRQRMAAGRRDEKDILEDITVPVSIVSGSLDPSSNPDVMKPIAEAMTHAPVHFTTIDDAGHFTSFEKPAEVARTLLILADDVMRRETENRMPVRPYHSRRAKKFGFESLRQGQTLADIPLTDGSIEWRIDEREKINSTGWHSVLSRDDVRVILIDNDKIALAQKSVQSGARTGHLRRLAMLEGSYVAEILSVYPQALYYLGQIVDPATGIRRNYVALNIAGLAEDSGTKLRRIIDHAQQRFEWQGVREAAEELSSQDTQLAVMSTGLGLWHSRAQHCGQCGAPNHVMNGGWAVQCDEVPAHMGFPRIEPAMIVRITDDHDRILLQHNKAWPEGRYSVCSGFVEVGETVEHSVHREVKEELGIEVQDVHYLGSQPWPFPGSLMLAFGAQAKNLLEGDEEDIHRLVLDDREVGDARWFSRDELMDALARGTVHLAVPSSIALKMIEQWYGAKLG